MRPLPSAAGKRSPHRHAQPAHAAGTPTTIACGATSVRTTAPAPTNAYSPIVTPQITFPPPGTYSYLCTLHTQNMKATVQVS